MALREYYSEDLGLVWVVDHIRITDKMQKSRATVEGDNWDFKQWCRKNKEKKNDRARIS